MSIRSIGAGSTATRTAVTFALALAAVGGLATSSQSATTVSSQPAMTLNVASGKETGGNTLLASTTTAKFYTGKVAVQFQLTTSLTGNCQTNYTTVAANSVIAAPTFSIVNSKKLAITVPTLTGSTANTTQLWLVCAYNSNSATTSKLLAKASYTTAGAPHLTALAAGGVSVPTYGGTTISVVGDGFSAGINSATLGGKALSDINVVDDTLFTATTPANPVGGAALTVNTVGGTATILSTATNKYTYVDSIQVSPTTAVTSTSVTMSVQGYGFNNTTWSASSAGTPTPDDASAHVYLLANGAYDPTGAGNKATSEKNECVGIQVVDDNNLVCTLDLSKSHNGTYADTLTGAATGNGLYQVSIVTDGTHGANSGARAAQALSSGASFTVAPF